MYYKMSISKSGIPPERFYDGKNTRQEEIEAIIKNNDNFNIPKLPKFMNSLSGPSRTWKIFKKQQDAMDLCLHKRNGLMPFAFEDINMRRLFLAAHPKVFWAHNSHRFFKDCSSYEIIREHSACKLYLDIEFEYIYNNDKNGDRMLNNLLNIINFNMKKIFNVTCSRNDILDLDSSSDTKFSRHVIYQIRNVAFQDNYAVGSFVRKICEELKEAFDSNLSEDRKKLEEVADKYSLTSNEIIELFISDRKGQTKLLVDEGVYTKNRHFRLLGSSKKSKNIPLKISLENKYKPSEESSSLEYFLDSLITYFSWNVERILEFTNPTGFKPQKQGREAKLHNGTAKFSNEFPLHPQLDSFIKNLISPNGTIRRKVFFNDTATIVYEIQGFRFCHNINREHKSNNIKYVVDLQSLGFYQKCYDPDCADFRSDMKRLPEEICFLFEDDKFLVNDFEEISEEFIKSVNEMLGEDNFEETVSDMDLLEAVNCAEAVMNIDW